MTRKSPYLHPVSGHYRDGRYVEKYKRGEGDQEKNNPRPKTRSKSRPRTGYSVTYSFPSGNKETYTAPGTVTGALKATISMIQRPELPTRALLRRISR